MRIVVLANVASGRGGAGSLAAEAEAALAREGHEVVRTPIRAGWDGELAGAGLVVACGGDGTLACAAEGAMARGVPVHHLPRGTENLFAREFGMRADVAALVEAVRAWRVEPFDVGTCNGRVFVLMASVGFDADVLHALAAVRRGPISHRSYVKPVLRTLLGPTIRAVTIEVDGRAVVEGRKGNVVVANCGRYALGLDPCDEACMSDGMLDVCFVPSGSSVRTIAWMGAMLAGVGRRSRALVRAKGASVVVRVEGAGSEKDGAIGRFQIDGEAASDDACGGVFTMGVRERALRVLLPTG